MGILKKEVLNKLLIVIFQKKIGFKIKIKEQDLRKKEGYDKVYEIKKRKIMRNLFFWLS